MLFSNYVFKRSEQQPTSKTEASKINMKKLYIIRHAKAENPTFDSTDFERNLIAEGIAKAVKKAKLLAQEDDVDFSEKTQVISSTANRATQTAAIFCEELQIPLAQIQYESTIYEAHYLALLKVLNDCPASTEKLFIFGHNPGLSDLIAYISNDYINLATANIACLTLDENIDFSSLSANTCYLNKII